MTDSPAAIAAADGAQQLGLGDKGQQGHGLPAVELAVDVHYEGVRVVRPQRAARRHLG